MSRIGKKPIPIPDKVKVEIKPESVVVTGPKGTVSNPIPPGIRFEQKDKQILAIRKDDSGPQRAYHGLARAIVANAVKGVTDGFTRELEIVGVGYLAAIQGNTLQLRVGYANEVHKSIPAGLKVTCPDQTHILVQGCDKQLVGQFAAEVRSVRKPEPYKGKGVRYEGEHVKIKPGKSAT